MLTGQWGGGAGISVHVALPSPLLMLGQPFAVNVSASCPPICTSLNLSLLLLSHPGDTGSVLSPPSLVSLQQGQGTALVHTLGASLCFFLGQFSVLLLPSFWLFWCAALHACHSCLSPCNCFSPSSSSCSLLSPRRCTASVAHSGTRVARADRSLQQDCQRDSSSRAFDAGERLLAG